jgi:hypothetical protein
MLKIYTIQNKDEIKLMEEQDLVLKGQKSLLEINSFFEIWKVKKPYELKLVAFISLSRQTIQVIESIACFPAKTEIERMIVEFNSALKAEKIDFMSVKLKF